ncbi:ATP-binding protein [Streptomyces sp. NPDC001663]|uniref:ATP-binding protein n=1 Tax=Streptomyces sp. NPDC001663 TaxID=3364597 RepID=UPI0036AD6371
MSRKPWDLAFTAEPEEVGALRRILRLHLQMWGLHDITDEAQLCVSELGANVITHVGHGTPATLMVSMNGTHLRIEVHDPDTRALPTLVDAGSDSEGGRGMALVDAVADRWGVFLRPDRKVTWCELATGLTPANGHATRTGVITAEASPELYTVARRASEATPSRLTWTVALGVVIDVITDSLHWLRAWLLRGRGFGLGSDSFRVAGLGKRKLSMPKPAEAMVSDARRMARIRSLALEVQEIDEAWTREAKEFVGEHGEVPLRLLSPYDEVETDYARMAWRVASVLARELLA